MTFAPSQNMIIVIIKTNVVTTVYIAMAYVGITKYIKLQSL